MNFLRSPSGRGKAYTFLRDLSVMSIPDHIISVSAAIAQFLPLEFSVPDTPICCTLSHPVHLRYPTFVPFVLGVTNTQLTNNVAYGYNIITQLISIDSNKSTFMGLKIPVWAVQFCPPAPLGNTGLVLTKHKPFFVSITPKAAPFLQGWRPLSFAAIS